MFLNQAFSLPILFKKCRKRKNYWFLPLCICSFFYIYFGNKMAKYHFVFYNKFPISANSASVKMLSGNISLFRIHCCYGNMWIVIIWHYFSLYSIFLYWDFLLPKSCPFDCFQQDFKLSHHTYINLAYKEKDIWQCIPNSLRFFAQLYSDSLYHCDTHFFQYRREHPSSPYIRLDDRIKCSSPSGYQSACLRFKPI